MKKILVIEDEEFVRESIIDILEDENYEVISAENGEDGFFSASKYLPDLILSDVKMPRIDGFQFLEKLKSNKLTAFIPFVFITGQKQKHEHRQGMSSGADDYLTKPFTSDELVEAVEAQFEKQESLKFRNLEEVKNMKLSLTSSFPHEFRTPLNGIVGPVQMLINDIDSFEKTEIIDFLKIIDKSVKRLSQLVDNFLFFNELDAVLNSPEELNNFKGSISYNVRDILLTNSKIISMEYNRTSDLQIDVENINLNIKLEHLVKVLFEILSNAFKFSKKGDHVFLKSELIANYYIIEIRDRGLGFSPSQLNQIDMYKQFDRRNYEQQGMGLGLIISKSIIEIYGGSFKVNSVKNDYTTVKILIPYNNNNSNN